MHLDLRLQLGIGLKNNTTSVAKTHTCVVAGPVNVKLYKFQWKNYQAGVDFCHNEGKALCTFDQLCPGGWNTPSAVGQMDYDSYTPIDCTSDNSCTCTSDNGCTSSDGLELVQIGNYAKGTCGRYFNKVWFGWARWGLVDK